MSEHELIKLSFYTLLGWATEEAELNDEGEEGIETRYAETVETYLENLEQTLNGEVL
tara:strand:+ start:1346 stop:1516 length:171 start_codon:yes stop_codon:yes gene_type:complete